MWPKNEWVQCDDNNNDERHRQSNRNMTNVIFRIKTEKSFDTVAAVSFPCRDECRNMSFFFFCLVLFEQLANAISDCACNKRASNLPPKQINPFELLRMHSVSIYIYELSADIDRYNHEIVQNKQINEVQSHLHYYLKIIW